MTSSVLGIDLITGEKVYLSQSARRQGLYIIGSTGTGKSTLIENLIVQDIKQGLGVCLLDPNGDVTLAVLSRLPDHREKDVILLDIVDEEHPFGLNLLEYSNPKSSFALLYSVDQVMHVFERQFNISSSTPLIAEYLRSCTYTLAANPGYTIVDLPLLLTDEKTRKNLVANVDDLQVLLFWQEFDNLKPNERREVTSSILRRVREFLQPLIRNIIGQTRTTIDFREVMDEGKILLVKLDSRLPYVTNLIGSIITAELLSAAYSRTELPSNKRKQFNIYMDEFQQFATDDFASLAAEARKFGIAITIAHQTRDQLDKQSRATTLQMANIVAFRISGKDAEELTVNFDLTPFPTETTLEPILTPVQNVVDHMGKHPNPVVNKFVNGLLREIDRLSREAENDQRRSSLIGISNAINSLLYQVMVDKNPQISLPDSFTNELYRIIADKSRFEAFIIELRDVMQVLADEPIIEAQGHFKEQSLVQITYADMASKVATELANLPRYTAMVKILADENAGEYIVKTVESEKGLGKSALQARIERIKAQNITSGFTRLREEVEEEIDKRQQRLLERSASFRPQYDWLHEVAHQQFDKGHLTDSSIAVLDETEVLQTIIRIRITEEPLTAQNLITIISALTELYTKCWLIGQGRFADLIEYTQTRNARFAQKAHLVIARVAYNSPFNMDWKVDLSAPSVAEAFTTAIDAVTQRQQRLEKAELENRAKRQEIEQVKQKAAQENKLALLDQERQELEVERQRLELLEKRLEVQKKGIEFAIEIANKMVDILRPSADEDTRAMLIQAVLPNLLQLDNGKGLELILPKPLYNVNELDNN